MTSTKDLTAKVKSLAGDEGFARVGVVCAGPVDRRAVAAYRRWIARGGHAGMDYLSRNADVRADPSGLAAGAKSVICLAVGYASGPDQPAGAAFVSRYARGRDYHKVLKRRCARLMDRIRAIEPAFDGRAFVDTAPLMERTLAAAAGVGWIGRNGCLIAPGLGSYLFLCEIVCNLSLQPDGPLPGGCGDCRACLDACPTGALLGDGTMNAGRCISYLTIEHRGAIPPALRERMGKRVFGCDCCQEACPHNTDAPPGDAELRGENRCPRASVADILPWNDEDYADATRGSALGRATREMFLRNAIIAAGNGGDDALRPALEQLAAANDALSEAARWALRRLAGARGNEQSNDQEES